MAAAIGEICKDKAVMRKLPYRQKRHTQGNKNDARKALAAQLRKILASLSPSFGLLVGNEEGEPKIQSRTLCVDVALWKI